jgi:hypothetical protein
MNDIEAQMEAGDVIPDLLVFVRSTFLVWSGSFRAP